MILRIRPTLFLPHLSKHRAPPHTNVPAAQTKLLSRYSTNMCYPHRGRSGSHEAIFCISSSFPSIKPSLRSLVPCLRGGRGGTLSKSPGPDSVFLGRESADPLSSVKGWRSPAAARLREGSGEFEISGINIGVVRMDDGGIMESSTCCGSE